MATKTKELANLNPTVRDMLAAVIYGYGEGAPTDNSTGVGEAGVGALYLDITNATLYKNTGTLAAPTWNAVGGIAASEITLAEGNVLIGNSSGVGVALDIGATDTGIAIGNGTTATVAALSGDVTMANTGVVTIAAGAVDPAMQAITEGNLVVGDSGGAGTLLDASTDTQILVGDGTTVASVAVSGDATLANTGALTVADSVLDGSNAANVADANVIGGQLLVHRILLASGADANVDVALTHKTLVTDAVVILKGAGTAGSDVQIQNVTTAISDLIDVSGGADKAIFRPSTWDDAQDEIAAAANLRVAYTSTGGDFPGAEVYVYGMRIA